MRERFTRCPLRLECNGLRSRRAFLRDSLGAVAGSILLGGCAQPTQTSARPVSSAPALLPEPSLIRACGPASKHTATLHAAFVRRKSEYGMRWPGAVYDGEAAKKRYTKDIRETAARLGAKLELRTEPLHSLAESQEWIAGAESAGADGLFLVTLDRQEHAWPTARKVAESAVPSVIYSPLGTSFTTNTAWFAQKSGCVVYATAGDFDQAAYGMKMLCAVSRLQRCRCLVIRGSKEYDAPLSDLGIQLRYVPAKRFLDAYNEMGETPEILALAEFYISRARRQSGPTRQDVINSVKSYYVAGKLLEEAEADAISMDCLGALGRSKASLPCIAWSRMNDDGIPAACEADTGAIASHTIVQYLFDRPGFQQDPVPDTSDDTIIGAHCCCATKLNGFDRSPEPFDIIHHHGNRDAVPRTLWEVGRRITSLDVLPARNAGGSSPTVEKVSTALISTGVVVANIDVPPAGGCVVSVKIKFDGGTDVLSFPGFHQIFFYGDYGKQLEDFCQLYGMKAQVV